MGRITGGDSWCPKGQDLSTLECGADWFAEQRQLLAALQGRSFDFLHPKIPQEFWNQKYLRMLTYCNFYIWTEMPSL